MNWFGLGQYQKQGLTLRDRAPIKGLGFLLTGAVAGILLDVPAQANDIKRIDLNGIDWDQVELGQPTRLYEFNDLYDPADQVAPAGLEVQPGPLPINRFQALKMQQELENLIGRFESALLSAISRNSSVHLEIGKASEETLTASVGDAGFESVPKWVPHPTLVQAQQFLEDWPSLLQAQEYEIARER
ncbi:MAG: hypothetical protein F6K19_41360, partial [Cyanothece sp. SIO1E1]|nr:hypothetical protein [Cyanothece sp. SIO1E1]